MRADPTLTARGTWAWTRANKPLQAAAKSGPRLSARALRLMKREI